MATRLGSSAGLRSADKGVSRTCCTDHMWRMYCRELERSRLYGYANRASGIEAAGQVNHWTTVRQRRIRTAKAEPT